MIDEDEDEEVIFTRGVTDYEDFVISLMADKTAEQVDGTKLTAEDVEKARHLARNIRMFGKLDPDVIDQNYLKAVVEGNPLAEEYEAEREYLAKYGKGGPEPVRPSEQRRGEMHDDGEYDGRDDAFISEMLSGGNSRLMDSGYIGWDGENPDENRELGEEDGFDAGEMEKYRELL